MDEDSPRTAKVKRKAPKKLSESYLRNSALYYLQRHPASVSHFIEVMDRKMKRSAKAHPDQDLPKFAAFLRTTLVPDLQRAGLLNDELYAQALAGSLQRRGLPKRAITMRLNAKGLEADDTLIEQTDLQAACRFAKRKRLGPFCKRDTDPQKQLATLARAGFSYDVASRVIKADMDTISEILADD